PTGPDSSAHKLHTKVLHGFDYTDATGFGIEVNCGPLDGVLGYPQPRGVRFTRIRLAVGRVAGFS
ncbi:MAG TPA: hypothetical protein VHM70_31650, partial [Polyangiaceae bacterium]|nr:hypothetical protein [Polyangiaceae bacterium]